MSNRTWCDKHPHDCARAQRQQEREWRHTHDFASGPLDVIAAVAIVGLCVLFTL
ncbi:hypothetical protein [Roseibium sp.]|uniref:hypothetical protein n=1 Tax=Roseibium sp. TaxID=1936156 RepID=UPI003B508A6A